MLYAIYYEHYRICWRCVLTGYLCYMLFTMSHRIRRRSVLTDVDGHGAGGDALAMLYAIYYEPLNTLAMFLQM